MQVKQRRMQTKPSPNVIQSRKFMEIVSTRGQILMAKCTKIDFCWGSAPDPAGGAYNAPPDTLVGWGGWYPLPIPYPPRRLWRLDPRAFGARLGACGASLLMPSAFGCLTEAKTHPTSSFWRRHWLAPTAYVHLAKSTLVTNMYSTYLTSIVLHQ